VVCPVCSHQNEPGSRFCAQCGTELTVTCPACGTSSPLGVRFCSSCGTAVEGSAPETDDPLARFVPPEMLSKLRSARAGQAMRGERRTVTMLFADIKGSTAAAERLDPEEWADVMNGAFEYLIAPIYRYEGTLARLLGDAVLAFFGAPIAHEDDPVRALRAALEITGGVTEYCREVASRHGIPIEVRVGVNTGLVVVGEVGSDLRVEYTALGDAINVAARMEQTAKPGTIQVTEHTLSLTHGAFEAEDLGLVELKGKADPVRTFRPIRYVGRPLAGPAPRVIGRDAELAELDALPGHLLGGRGWIASVVGEAGLGKSTLIREWLHRTEASTTLAKDPAAAGDLAWLFGASQSYDASIPMAGIRDVLQRWFRLDGTGGFERIEAATVLVELDDVATFLGYIAGVELPAEAQGFVDALEPPVLRARSREALSSYIVSEAGRRPVAIVFEDLHWADDLSVDIIADLLELTERAPVGILVAMRPYRDDPSWRVHERAARGHQHRYHHLTLEPMPDADAAALLDELVGSTRLVDADRRMILERSAGSPLFLEEIAHSVQEGGGAVGVPSSLSGILTARLDRLDERAHLVAQVASVLGTEFRRDSVGALVDGAGIDDTITSLLRSGVLVESSAGKDLRFRHALMQEAAYESILLKTRRTLHRRIADHLITAQPDGIEDIARHLVAAQDFDVALPYIVEAGYRATRTMSLADAIRQFRLALEHAPEDADPALMQRAHLGLGEAYALLPDLSESAAAFQRLFDFGERHRRPTAQVAALNHLAFTTALVGGDPAAAAGYLADARRLAEEIGDERGLADYHMNACMVASFSGDPTTAVDHDQATIALGAHLGDDRIRVQGLVRRAINQVLMLDLDNAETSLELAMGAAREGGLEEATAELGVLGSGLILLSKGECRVAARVVEANIPTLERYGSFATPGALRLLGFMRHQLGDVEGALASMAAARRWAQLAGQLFVDRAAAAGMAAIYATVGRVEEIPALREAAEAMEGAPLGDLYASTAWADIGTAELFAGDPVAAEAAFSRGLGSSSLTQYLERTRLLAGLALSLDAQGVSDRPETLLGEAREFATSRSFSAASGLLDYVEGSVRRTAGDRSAAEAALSSAYRTAEDRGQRLLAAAAAWALAEVAGDPDPHVASARRIAADIGREIVDEGLRASFLNRWTEPVSVVSA
jgi:class 3 adenylate cyclase/tetratricopeptide (TPR) repeat protein